MKGGNDMKLHLGDVSDLSESKRANVVCTNHKPEIFGIIGGVIITLLGRHLYKAGVEDAMDADNRALAEIGVMEYNPKKDRFKAKVLK
jgi:hypothetical protein